VDDLALLERAMDATRRVVHGVRPEQHDGPTPCSAWNVRALMNHLVGGNRFFAARARGEQPELSVLTSDHVGDGEPAAVYDESAQEALAAWRTPGAVDRTATLPSGGAGPKVINMHLMDVFVHGWDLATATGQDRSLDRDVGQVLYERWHGTVAAEVRGEGGIFGQEVAVPPDAPVADRLAAYLGRRP
jgi:uncharacterized protein (TIGR03086 family)